MIFIVSGTKSAEETIFTILTDYGHIVGNTYLCIGSLAY